MPAALRWLLWRDTRVMVLRETGAVAFSLTFGQRPAFAKVPMELASTELFLGWATFRGRTLSGIFAVKVCHVEADRVDPRVMRGMGGADTAFCVEVYVGAKSANELAGRYFIAEKRFADQYYVAPSLVACETPA